MFRYRLHLEDGSDAGEATYPVMIRTGRGDHSSATTGASASSTSSRRERWLAVCGAAAGRGRVGLGRVGLGEFGLPRLAISEVGTGVGTR
jgi:hypothetical protein